MLQDIAALFTDAETRQLQAGAVLFRAGDPVGRVYLVREGALVLARMTGAGASVVLQRATAGQVLAEASLYSPTYHCEARAERESVLLGMPVARFRDHLRHEPVLGDLWAAHLAHAVQAARFRAELRTLRTVAERLDAWLGEGRALPAKGVWQDLAAELGVTREALYRHLATRPDLTKRPGR